MSTEADHCVVCWRILDAGNCYGCECDRLLRRCADYERGMVRLKEKIQAQYYRIRELEVSLAEERRLRKEARS